MTENRFLNTLRQLHPSGEPSTKLLEKIATIASQVDAPATFKTRQYPLSWKSAVSAAVAVAAASIGFAFLLAPRMTLAYTLKTVYSNLLNAQGSHCRIIFSPQNKQALIMEVWSHDGKWRQDSTVNGVHLVQIRANGKFWNYYPADHRATYQETARETPMTAINGERVQAQVYQALNDVNGKNLGVEMRDGRPLQKIAIPGQVQRFFFSSPEAGRSVFWIDKEKMLPAVVEQQIFQTGKWETVQQVEFDFGPPISPAVFSIPSEVHCDNVDTLGEEIGRQFARPLAQKRFLSRTIALRDVQVNEDGDVFVLYTDSSTHDKHQESVARVIGDDLGTHYAGTAGAIEPFLYCSDNSDNRGLMVGKEAVSGICAIPVTPFTGTDKPRKITVEIHFVEQIRNRYFTRTALFTVPIQRPVAKLLPTYGPALHQLSLTGGDVTQFQQDREWGRRAYFYNERDWSGLIASTDRAIRQGITDVNTYLDRATAYENLGRRAEAAAQLTHAQETDTNGFNQDQIKSAEKRLRETNLSSPKPTSK